MVSAIVASPWLDYGYGTCALIVKLNKLFIDTQVYYNVIKDSSTLQSFPHFTGIATALAVLNANNFLHIFNQTRIFLARNCLDTQEHCAALNTLFTEM